MKYMIRVFVFSVFSLWFTSQLFPMLILSGGWQALFEAGLIMSLLLIFIKPLLKILFIPINLITFGLMSWVINVILMYLLTVFMPSVAVKSWTFPGISYGGFVMPSLYLSYTSSLVITSLVVTFFTNVLHSISEH